jgi:hypothetical protein
MSPLVRRGFLVQTGITAPRFAAFKACCSEFFVLNDFIVLPSSPLVKKM